MTTEPLEPRRLLAGVTLLTHGYNGDVNGWIDAAAADIQGRLGSDASTIYTMNVRKSGSGLAVTSFAADDGQTAYDKTTQGEIIVKLDWSTVSTGSYTTQAVAEVVSDYMLDAHGTMPALAELPIHLVGHSRGASVIAAMSQDLGKRGVWVDQNTFLDPHPVNGDNDFYGVSFGDQAMAVYDNVAFADDYWRTDGDANNGDFDGEYVDGSYDADLNNIVQKNFIQSAHAAVVAYYVGTIDTSTYDGGLHPVLPSWYGDGNPERDETGYIYSRIVGHSRPSTGVSSLLGGKGSREEAGESGSQWGNVFNFTSRGSSTVSAGTTIRTQFLVADRDGKTRVEVYADTDANPYNGSGTQLSSKTFSSTELAAGKLTVGTSGLSTGTYYLAAKAVDSSGHVRWTYSPTTIKLAAANFATLASGVLTVTGTAVADRIAVGQTATTITAVLNGATQTFDADDVNQINVQAGDGNDNVDMTGVSRPVYVFGDLGADFIVGGTGNDTLSGGAQSDTVYGNTGDDRLNGNGGNNLLVGNGGDDRLYGFGGQDTMYGSANTDRFFGGSGNEIFYGEAGNDKIYASAGDYTLIGGACVDILAGGSGTNTADNDPLDLRSEIQVLL